MLKKISKPNFISFVYRIYAFKFFSALNFIIPLYALMFSDYGVSYTDISWLFILWSVSVMVCSVPLGASADKYSRKKILLLGQFAKIGCFLSWIFIPDFWGFLLGFFLWGIQWTTATGIFEAFLYDELKKYRQERLYSKISGRVQGFNIAGYLLASTGSLLLFLGYDFILWLSILSVLLSILCLVGIPYRKPEIVSVEIVGNYFQAIKGASKEKLKLLFSSYRVLGLLVLLSIVVGLGYIDEYFGLIGLEIGMAKSLVGLLFIGVYLSNAFGSICAHYFLKLSFRKVLFGVMLLGILFCLIFFFYNLFSIALLCIFFFLYGIVFNLILVKYQQSIPSKYRGLFMSFYSFCEQISTISSYFIMMIGYEIGNYSYAFLALGIIVFFTGLVYLVNNQLQKA